MITLLIYAAIIPIAHFNRGAYWQWKNPFTTTNHQSIYLTYQNYFPDKKAQKEEGAIVRSKVEGCLLCHQANFGFSPSHDPKIVGCSGCHLGEIFSSNKEVAHKNMILIPGNISEAKMTCGSMDCHEDIVGRVEKSMMNKVRGMIAVDRFAFGEIDKPNGLESVENLSSSSADTHLKQLCIVCHLGNEKKEAGVIDERSRGGGCLACHLSYDKKKMEDKNYHPALNIKITSDHCFGCHSRSGRISTNYEGWHETKLQKEEMVNLPSEKYRVLKDQRVFEKKEADVHFLAGMECIDCHTSRESMGDGKSYLHQEQQIEIGCSDCHIERDKETVSWEKLSAEDKKIVRLRAGLDLEKRKFLLIKKNREVLVNGYLEEKSGLPVLEGKISGKIFKLKGPTTKCSKNIKGHERVACLSCHSSWAPQCLSCHTQKDKNGKWLEYSEAFLADAPSLGVFGSGKKEEKIITYAPGMVMTLGAEKKLVRLFAPVYPHTIAKGKNSRSCISCHFDSNAIGVGRGELLYDKVQKMVRFKPRYQALADNLPADGWTEFLQDNQKRYSATREDSRPFNKKEQQDILRVGLCLSCHKFDNNSFDRIYKDFKKSLTKLNSQCLNF